jgi:hypothetical protein
MKIAAAAALTFAGLMAGSVPAAAEVNYPYCIINGGMSEGSMSCGYTSLAQCMATRVGTDMCVVNPRYQAGPPPGQRERARPR